MSSLAIVRRVTLTNTGTTYPIEDVGQGTIAIMLTITVRRLVDIIGRQADSTDLNDEEIADLRKLAKEMICPFVRNNKCHFSEEDCVYG